MNMFSSHVVILPASAEHAAAVALVRVVRVPVVVGEVGRPRSRI